MMKIKHSFVAGIILFNCYTSFSQDSVFVRYSNAYKLLQTLIQNPQRGDFKKAVFLTETTYKNYTLDESEFDNKILLLSFLADSYNSSIRGFGYRYADSNNMKLNFAIYTILKDTVTLSLQTQGIGKTTPFTYDFNDFFGYNDWSNMFVTKLLATHSGNCHSLPYLYKILADELGATCWLALAPNHMYIENRSKKIGWYNTELTSGEFPIDAWIMGSGYIPLQAIQHGIYMDTLSNQQSIALCVLDLAKGYEHQTKNYLDGFIIKCCDLSLQYFPLNVQAMLLKAETLKRIYQRQKINKSKEAKETYTQMEQIYIKLFDLGYREMPEKMYMQWLTSVTKEREKYSNKQVKESIQNK